MDRKEFLKNCAGGVCACAAASFVSVDDVATAETAPAEDWRLRFVKRRYAKLLDILSSKMDEKELNDTLHQLGTFCSSSNEDWIKKYRGDFDGFAKAMKQSASGDTVTFDREKGIITMDSGERTDCFCPLNHAETPDVVCNCSLGWQQHTWETFLQKKVKVELRDAVLRGGKRCLFEIHVLS